MSLIFGKYIQPKNHHIFLKILYFWTFEHILAIYQATTGQWLKTITHNQDLNLLKLLCPETNNCLKYLQIGNQKWSVQFLPTAAYLNHQLRSKVWLTLLFCLTISGRVSADLPGFLSRYRHRQKSQILFGQMQQ